MQYVNLKPDKTLENFEPSIEQLEWFNRVANDGTLVVFDSETYVIQMVNTSAVVNGVLSIDVVFTHYNPVHQTLNVTVSPDWLKELF